MDIEIRAPRDDEAEDVFALCSEAFTSPPEREEPWRESKRMEDFLCAWSDGELVGTTEVMPGGQYFGGRSVPMGGVASVAVRPDQRGRGIAPRLLAQAVERMHEQGLVISTLHPATARFCRGLGWEIGGEFGVRRPDTMLAALPASGANAPSRPGRRLRRLRVLRQSRTDDQRRPRPQRRALARVELTPAIPHRYRYVYDATTDRRYVVRPALDGRQ